MTAADRLRAAVEAALPCEFPTDEECFVEECPASHRKAVLAAVRPIVEELGRDRERIRAKCEQYLDSDQPLQPAEVHAVMAFILRLVMKGERDGD